MQWTLWACWLKPGVLTLPPSTSFSLHAYLSLQLLSMLLEMNIDNSERAFSIPPHGQLGASGILRPFFSSLCVRYNACSLLPPPLLLLLSLMHLSAALKGCGLMIGDHSTYLRCSCKYSNEPSSVDSVRDNGSIFYLPLLVCDSRIYLVDCIIVPKSAWFAGINFSRHTSFPAPAEANAYSFRRLSFQ